MNGVVGYDQEASHKFHRRDIPCSHSIRVSVILLLNDPCLSVFRRSLSQQQQRDVSHAKAEPGYGVSCDVNGIQQSVSVFFRKCRHYITTVITTVRSISQHTVVSYPAQLIKSYALELMLVCMIEQQIRTYQRTVRYPLTLPKGWSTKGTYPQTMQLNYIQRDCSNNEHTRFEVRAKATKKLTVFVLLRVILCWLFNKSADEAPSQIQRQEKRDYYRSV